MKKDSSTEDIIFSLIYVSSFFGTLICGLISIYEADMFSTLNKTFFMSALLLIICNHLIKKRDEKKNGQSGS